MQNTDIKNRNLGTVKVHKVNNGWEVMLETTLLEEGKRFLTTGLQSGHLERYNGKWYRYIPFNHIAVNKKSRWSNALETHVMNMSPELAIWTIAINSKINSGWVIELLDRPKAVGIGRITGYMKVFPNMTYLNNQQKIRFINRFPEAAGLPASYQGRK